jgi:hypothetical protein
MLKYCRISRWSLKETWRLRLSSTWRWLSSFLFLLVNVLVRNAPHSGIDIKDLMWMLMSLCWWMQSLVSRGLFDGCGFYRAEPSGPTIDAGRNDFRKGFVFCQLGSFSWSCIFSCSCRENENEQVGKLLMPLLLSDDHIQSSMLAGMHYCRVGSTHVGVKKTRSCLWRPSWTTAKGLWRSLL